MNSRLLLEKCLDIAEYALKQGNYPIGSLLVNGDGDVIATAGNENTTSGDISAHAEILCLRKAGLQNLSKDLSFQAFLFSSEEPCCGCSFFIARTNISRVIWALSDPYREGLKRLKTAPEFDAYFKNITIEIEPYEELKNRSKDLLKKYFLSKGNLEMAKLHS